jgi:hypothetical protein
MTLSGLAINAALAATFKTLNAISYLSDGIFKAKAALAAQAFTAGHATLNAGQVGYFVVALDGSGAVSTIQGIGTVPDVANGLTAIGIIKITVNSSTFVPGTTALDAGTITPVYLDVSVLPSNTAP